MISYEVRSEVYILAYGSEYIDDYDVDIGVFTSKEKVKAAYDKLYGRKKQDIQEYGYSLIGTIKIFSYHKVDELDEDLYNNRYRVDLAELEIVD